MTLKRDLQYLEHTIRSNTDTVDRNVLPSLQNLLTSIEEGSVLLAALKKQQMLLLETEDEVSGQFNYILEQRDDRVKRSQEVYPWHSIILIILRSTMKPLNIHSKSLGTQKEQLRRKLSPSRQRYQNSRFI